MRPEKIIFLEIFLRSQKASTGLYKRAIRYLATLKILVVLSLDQSFLMLWTSFLLLGLVQLCTSEVLTKRWNDVTEKHSWVETPRGWRLKGPAPLNHIFQLKIGLKQHGFEDLVANLMEISDPAHSR